MDECKHMHTGIWFPARKTFPLFVTRSDCPCYKKKKKTGCMQLSDEVLKMCDMNLCFQINHTFQSSYVDALRSQPHVKTSCSPCDMKELVSCHSRLYRQKKECRKM